MGAPFAWMGLCAFPLNSRFLRVFMRLLYYVASGCCACFIGIGLSRFAYAPLIPEIIRQQWFNASQTAYLGATNLAGYLIGAFFSSHMAAKIGAQHGLRLMMLLASAAFLASAYPISFEWYFFWRLTSGIAGGGLMVLSAANVVSVVPVSRRGVASGVVLTGLGMGVMASAILVPALVAYGLKTTWLLFGAISCVLTLYTWWGWPTEQMLAAHKAKQEIQTTRQKTEPHLKALYKLCVGVCVGGCGVGAAYGVFGRFY